MPGSAPEYWPQDWQTYDGNDGYGWGASTATLLIRHLVGFKESRQTEDWVAELTPALPVQRLRVGGRYGVRQLTYRQLTFDLTYVLEADGLWAELDLGGERRSCQVRRLDLGTPPAASDRQPSSQVYGCACASGPTGTHRFPVDVGRRYELRLN
jgi:hypothetical protein